MLNMWTGIIMILGCGHGQVEAAVGGVPHASPTAVAIIKDGQLCCSGTILSPISVLTDGNKVCWKGEGLSVVAGVTSFDIVEGKGLFLDWITQYRVERVISHPDYNCGSMNGNSGENGLAILVLKEGLTLGVRLIAATLPNPDTHQTVPGTSITTGGWGYNFKMSDRDTTRTFQKITTTIQPDKTCRAVRHLGLTYVQDKQFCAGNKTVTLCMLGDAGAGAMTEGIYKGGYYNTQVILGVAVGLADNCDDAATFVSINQHLAWINETVGSLDSSANFARFSKTMMIFMIIYCF